MIFKINKQNADGTYTTTNPAYTASDVPTVQAYLDTFLPVIYTAEVVESDGQTEVVNQ
jgi:hypothetical protein